jgi:hypothetical protein
VLVLHYSPGMTPESLVVSLELARQLKEAGWPQNDSYLYRREMKYRGGKRWNRAIRSAEEKKYSENNPPPNPAAIEEENYCAAPTAEEILRRLPHVNIEWAGSHFYIECYKHGFVLVQREMETSIGGLGSLEC